MFDSDVLTVGAPDGILASLIGGDTSGDLGNFAQNLVLVPTLDARGHPAELTGDIAQMVGVQLGKKSRLSEAAR